LRDKGNKGLKLVMTEVVNEKPLQQHQQDQFNLTFHNNGLHMFAATLNIPDDIDATIQTES